MRTLPRTWGWRLIVWAVGVALLLAGVLAAGSAIAGVGALLIVLTVVPWRFGVQGYRERVARALGRTAHDLRAANDRSRMQARARLDDIRRVRAPDRLSDDAAELIALLETAGRIGEGVGGFRARAVELFDLQRRRAEVYERVASRATSDEERRYVATLTEMAAEGERSVDELGEENKRALSALMADLERISPPDRLREGHGTLGEVLREEYIAMSAYYTARRGTDTRALGAAAEQYELAVEERNRRIGALGLPMPRPAGDG